RIGGGTAAGQAARAGERIADDAWNPHLLVVVAVGLRHVGGNLATAAIQRRLRRRPSRRRRIESQIAAPILRLGRCQRDSLTVISHVPGCVGYLCAQIDRATTDRRLKRCLSSERGGIRRWRTCLNCLPRAAGTTCVL